MPVAPSTRPSIKVTVEIARDLGVALTSNRWYFSKSDGPTTNDEWENLINSLVQELRSHFDPNMTFVRADCYEPGLEMVVKTRELSGDGTATWTGTHAPSDCAAVMRFRTDARTSKNHPIYIFKYIHAIRGKNANVNMLDDSIVAGLTELGQDLLDSLVFDDGTNHYALCGPHGDIARDILVLPEVRHRDFPR